MTDDEFALTICPITMQIMKNPVIVNGKNYENRAIASLFRRTGKDHEGQPIDENQEPNFDEASHYIRKCCKHARKMRDRQQL